MCRKRGENQHINLFLAELGKFLAISKVLKQYDGLYKDSISIFEYHSVIKDSVKANQSEICTRELIC